MELCSPAWLTNWSTTLYHIPVVDFPIGKMTANSSLKLLPFSPTILYVPLYTFIVGYYIPQYSYCTMVILLQCYIKGYFCFLNLPLIELVSRIHNIAKMVLNSLYPTITTNILSHNQTFLFPL